MRSTIDCRPDQLSSSPASIAPCNGRADVARIAEFVEQERRRGSIAWNLAELRQQMIAQGFRTEFPADTYDGSDYGYDQRGGDFMVWSSGPDQRSWTEDDIRYDSRIGRITAARGFRTETVTARA